MDVAGRRAQNARRRGRRKVVNKSDKIFTYYYAKFQVKESVIAIDH